MNICSSENEYIKLISPHVQRACKRYGYLPSVLIAQSCLENGYGIPSYWDNPEIKLLIEGNNMVGIKAELLSSSWNDKTVWNGEIITKETPEEKDGKIIHIKDAFRKYTSIEESFVDYLLFMKYASNYGKGGTPKYGEKILSIKDPATLIREVSRLGYATGSTYSSSVMRIINKHDLTLFDNLSDITPTSYTEGKKSSTYKKIESKAIKDITKECRSEVPANRGSHSIDFIVIHYLGVPNADNPYLYGGGYGGHYNIKRDGTIYKAANPRTAVVWHCGGGLQGNNGHSFYKICTNYNSIGIECGVCYAGSEKEPSGDSNKWFFTEETQESLVWLVSKLMDEYNISIDRVIRHYDVTGKICPNPYVKNNGFMTSWTWSEFKTKLAQYRQHGTIETVNSDLTIKPKPDTQLKKGSKGDAVKTMQTMLIACGYSCGNAGADGDFGYYTESALKRFKIDNNLQDSGVYDKNTKQLLTTLYNLVIRKETLWKAVGTATATVNDLNVRQSADINSKILRTVNKGNRFEVDSVKSGNWIHVNVAGTIGWIHKNYVKYD